MPHFECGAFNHSATSPAPWYQPLSKRWRKNKPCLGPNFGPKFHFPKIPFERLPMTAVALMSAFLVRLASGRHRIVFGLQLRSADESEAREAVDRLSAAVSKHLNGRALPDIKADIIREIGTGADIQFCKGRELPNYHK
jgi:hypothetical protein